MRKITFKGKTDNIKEQGFDTIMITDCPESATIYFGDWRGGGFGGLIEIGSPYPISEHPLIYFENIDECIITYKFTNL